MRTIRLGSAVWCLWALGVSPALGAGRDDLNGVWLYTGSDTPEELYLTPAGQAMLDAYEPLIDDSDNYCIPASFTNIMHTPSPPFEIRLHEEHVEINYEFLDVKRRVPFEDADDSSRSLAEAPHSVEAHPHLGRSLARFEGETLVIDTVGIGEGYLDTLDVPGLPRSSQMQTQERFVPDGDRLEVVVTHRDPVNYTRDLIVRYGFHRLDSEILPWDCEPDAASYDRYLERSPRSLRSTPE